jgi:hypothetical protein
MKRTFTCREHGPFEAEEEHPYCLHCEDGDPATEFCEVEKPMHYNMGGIECLDAIKASMNPTEYQGYTRGNVQKYLWRFRYKAGVKDLKKAQFYLNELIESLEEEANED